MDIGLKKWIFGFKWINWNMVLDNMNGYMIWIIGFMVIEVGYGLDKWIKDWMLKMKWLLDWI